MPNQSLTQKHLKEILHYDPETGIFTRIKTRDIAGCLDTEGYRRIMVDGIRHKAHSLVWLYEYAAWPKDQIDHINHIRDDNRRCNLREVTRSENMRNRTKYKNNTSGVTGVSLHKPNSKWLSNIRINGKLKHLGYFNDINDAIYARKAAEIKYGFHANHGY